MEERNYCLYYHKSPSGKMYVGITSDIKRRWESKGDRYKGSKCFYNAIKRYGWDNIEHHIMHKNLTLKEASALEKLYIRLWGTLVPNGYNIAEGGSNGNNFVGKTEDEMKKIKKKMSEGHRGKTLSEEHKRKLSESHKGDKNPLYGKTPSEEHKRKISESKKGKTLSEETKKKIRESCKGDKHPSARKVKVYDKKGNFINEYPAISIACEELGLNHKKCNSNISECALGKRKSAYGYIWEY